MSTVPHSRAKSSRTVAVFACVVSLAVAASLAVAGASLAKAGHSNAADDTVETPSLGCGSAEVTKTLDTGSAWRMCARIDPIKGLVLEQVQFRPATGDREFQGWLPVVDSVYLAQLTVAYDTGDVAFNDVTGYGFGDAQLMAQTDQTCLGQTMPIDQSYLWGGESVERTIPGICLDEVDTGLGWVGTEGYGTDGTQYAQRGHALEVTSLTKISWYEYQQKVTLTDQGTITVGLGATGDLAPNVNFFPEDPTTGWPTGPESGETSVGGAASYWSNAMYRVDFGIGSGDQQVEQWDYTQPDPQSRRVEGRGTIQTRAFHADDDPDPQTWWRVLNPTSLNADGHPRSYEVLNDSMQDPYDPLTRPKVSFTNDHACQEYASDNLNAGCPGLSVPDYVAAETAPLTDPVAWVSVGDHRIPRDEDQSPMPIHWQEFSLIPRDVVGQQATTPIERSCFNGGPINFSGSCAAVNLVAPRVTTAASVLKVGTVLDSDRGTWRVARGPLSFERQWLRDGAPIVGATGVQYVVTAADRGHRLSVRVDAEAVGVIPGSATSAARRVASTPTLAVTQAKGQPRLTVRVTGKTGIATGSVVVSGPGGWKRTQALRSAAAVVSVPKVMVGQRARLVVSYRGNAQYLPVERAIRLR